MKQCFIPKRFNRSTQIVIHQANEIIEEYQQESLRLTLRQLYYQFVARDMLPNTQKDYHRLSRIISDARLAGLIDWDAIVDRTRYLRGINYSTDPGQTIKDCVYNFHLDHWEGQKYQLEVWIEKEALLGVISQICYQMDVDYFACKGYPSQTSVYDAAQRSLNHNRKTVIIHLGDHDPSGMDMTRDIEERMFLLSGRPVSIERIALNFDQVEEYSPPPNPAKMTDTRAREYISDYGHECWELDALTPTVVRDLIEDKVKQYRNDKVYKKVLKQEKEYKKTLQHLADNWEKV